MNLIRPIAVNWRSPLNRGLLCWFTMIDRHGINVRSVVGNCHGALTGIDPSTDWERTKLGSLERFALDFDGSGDYIQVPNLPASIFAGEYTISLWLYVTSNNNRTILDKRAGNNVGFRFRQTATTWELQHDADDFASGEIGPDAGVWQHVTGTRKGSRVQLCVDGVPFSSPATIATDASDSTEARIGLRSFGSANNPWSGYMTDIRVHNRGMMDQEMIAVYHESKRGWPTALRQVPPVLKAGVAAPVTEDHMLFHLF